MTAAIFMAAIILLGIIIVVLARCARQRDATRRELDEAQEQSAALQLETDRLAKQLAGTDAQRIAAEQTAKRLAKYQAIEDAEGYANEIRVTADEALSEAKNKATQITEAVNQRLLKMMQDAKLDAAAVEKEAREAAKQIRSRAAAIEMETTAKLMAAGNQATSIIEAAKAQANEIAGDAYRAMGRAKEFTDTANAMERVIRGYGNDYLVPTYSLLDDLAEDFGHTEAGEALGAARKNTRALVTAGRAATCEYVEANRKDTAIRFVVDAFNGKVDSILARSRANNHGTLEWQIRDAFKVVNHNGRAFREAKITEEYLDARLEELK